MLSFFITRHRILSRVVGVLASMFMLALAVTAASPSAVMAAPPPGKHSSVNTPYVLGCPTGGCGNLNNTDPVSTGCNQQSASVINSADISADYWDLGQTQLWWSNGCGTNWSELAVYSHIGGPTVTSVQSKLWYKSQRYGNVCLHYDVSGNGSTSPYWTNQQWLPNNTDYAESWSEININDGGNYYTGSNEALSSGWSGC